MIPKKIIVVSKSALKNCKNLGYCNYKLNIKRSDNNSELNENTGIDKKTNNYNKNVR